MAFADVINEYCVSLGCTNKELASRCAISPSAVSRYRKGERVPEVGGRSIERLSKGIAGIWAEISPLDAPSYDQVKQRLTACVNDEYQQRLKLCVNVNALMNMLGIRNSEMAKALHIDPSYLSRIRSQQRIPANPTHFARLCAQFITKRSTELHRQDEVSAKIGLTEPAPTKTKLTRSLKLWLLT